MVVARVAGLGALDVRQGNAVIVQIGVGDSVRMCSWRLECWASTIFLLVHFVVDAARFKTPGAAN